MRPAILRFNVASSRHVRLTGEQKQLKGRHGSQLNTNKLGSPRHGGPVATEKSVFTGATHKRPARHLRHIAGRNQPGRPMVNFRLALCTLFKTPFVTAGASSPI